MQFLKGRFNRATYWLIIGLCAGLYSGAFLITGKHISVSEVILIFICIPRLHDIGKSGWWAGGAVLAEVAALAIALTTLPLEQATQAMGIFVLTMAGLMIWLGCKAGQPFANAFGEPPPPGISFKKQPPSTTEPVVAPEN